VSLQRRFATLGSLVTLAWAAVSGQTSDASAGINAQRFLAAQFQLGSDDFRDLDRGRPVTRVLGTVDGREVAVLGAVRIRAPAVFYLEQLRDIVGFKKAGSAVLQIGAFSTPARVEDVAGLSLDARDVEHLRRCRPRDCKLQLSAEALERFRHDVPWDRADAGAAADRTMRQVLVDLVNRYRENGDTALMTYVDGAGPLSVSNEFRSMVASRPALLERFPRLHQHLLGFPRPSTEGVEDILYWSKEKMGPAVIVTVTHLALAPLAGGPAGAYAAASRQIYGSHYFDASLGLTVLLDAPGEDGAGMFMAYVNRSRLDALGGLFGGLKRTIVRSRARSAMRDSLVEARDLVEQRYRMRAARPSARDAAPMFPRNPSPLPSIVRITDARGHRRHVILNSN